MSRQLAHEGGKVFTPMYQLPLPPSPPPRKYSWYSFLLEDESTPVPQCGWKDYVNEKFHWNCQEFNPSGCSEVPQPTV